MLSPTEMCEEIAPGAASIESPVGTRRDLSVDMQGLTSRSRRWALSGHVRAQEWYRDVVAAAIDYPGDTDLFAIELERGDLISAVAESVSIEPVATVGRAGATHESYVEDNDIGHGIPGVNALVGHRARRSAGFAVSVRTIASNELGGHIFVVTELE